MPLFSGNTHFLPRLGAAMILLLSAASTAQATQPTGSMSVARTMHTAARLPDGRVLVVGGTADGPYSTATTEIYDPATGTFSPASPLAVSRTSHAIATLADGRILVIGGLEATESSFQVLHSAEIYDPLNGTWSETAGSLAGYSFAIESTAVTLLDGRVLVIGNGDTQLFDPANDQFSAPVGLPSGHYGASVALLPDGRVLLAGGDNGAGTSSAAAGIWDPATDTWSATGAMTTPRSIASATRLADGRILVAGGQNGNVSLGSAEVFDPVAQTFSPTGSLATARATHAAVALPDGSVLVAGGYGNSSIVASLERYDAATGTWSDAGTLNAVGFARSTATLLNDGKVLFAGGPSASGPGAVTAAELFTGDDNNLPPAANFSYAAPNLTVTFTDTSSDADGTIATRHWNFGDGTTSTATNPTKTYASEGIYTVTLTVQDDGGAADEYSIPVTVAIPNAAPFADFSVARSWQTATFSDSSVDSDGTIASYAWDFGDGTTSTERNPVKRYAGGGTYIVTLTVTDDDGATSTKSAPVRMVTELCSGTLLCNGIAATGLAVEWGGTLETYTLTVPPGATHLKFAVSGGTGNADILVKFGAAPTLWDFDCGTFQYGNEDICDIPAPQAGTYFVLVRTFTEFSGVSLTGSYSGDCYGSLCNGFPMTGLSADAGQTTATYSLVIPDGATNLSFSISGGTGDADLYVKAGTAPTQSNYDCRPHLVGNQETCNITSTHGIYYYVTLRGVTAFSGVSLIASYTP